MKVVNPGILFFTDGVLHLRGWLFDMEGQRFADPVSEGRAMLATALHYVGNRYCAAAAAVVPDPTECVPADVERLTQDVIAVCRWPEQGPVR